MPFLPEPDPRDDDAGRRPGRRRSRGRVREPLDGAPADPLVLFQTERGRVRRCDCCDTLRVHMGNALIAVDGEDFAQLLDAVAGFDRGDTPLGPWPAGHALLYVGESDVALAFTPDEIAELHRLLAGARLLLDLGSAPSADD